MNEHLAKDQMAYSSRPLYSPEPLFVKQGPTGRPVRAGKRTVVAVEDQWRIDDEWWRRESISRMYYAVILDNGQRLIIYKDLIKERWYEQTY